MDNQNNELNEVISNLQVCPVCKAVTNGDKYCHNCGHCLIENEGEYIYCGKCGNKLVANAKFCNKCGTPTSVEKNTELENDEYEEKKASQATVGFVLGLISIIAWFIPLIGYPITILGIIFSAKGLKANSNGKAIAGLVLSIIFLLVTMINSFLGAIFGAIEASGLYY